MKEKLISLREVYIISNSFRKVQAKSLVLVKDPEFINEINCLRNKFKIKPQSLPDRIEEFHLMECCVNQADHLYLNGPISTLMKSINIKFHAHAIVHFTSLVLTGMLESINNSAKKWFDEQHIVKHNEYVVVMFMKCMFYNLEDIARNNNPNIFEGSSCFISEMRNALSRRLLETRGINLRFDMDKVLGINKPKTVKLTGYDTKLLMSVRLFQDYHFESKSLNIIADKYNVNNDTAYKSIQKMATLTDYTLRDRKQKGPKCS